MSYTQLPGGDRLYRDDRAIIIKLSGSRKILSTSFLNGGCRLGLRMLFNYCEVYGRDDERCEMRAPSYKEHLQLIAEELGLDPSFSAGLIFSEAADTGKGLLAELAKKLDLPPPEQFNLVGGREEIADDLLMAFNQLLIQFLKGM